MTKRRRTRAASEGVSPADDASEPARLKNAKTILAGAAGTLLVGLGLSAIGDVTFGPYLTVLALGAGIFGAHKLGRVGRDTGWKTATAASHDE